MTFDKCSACGKKQKSFAWHDHTRNEAYCSKCKKEIEKAHDDKVKEIRRRSKR